MSRLTIGFLLVVCASLVSVRAAAGPVELLEGISINPADPSHMVVPYRYGGGGMFVSRDGGKTMNWLCSAGIAPNAVNRNGRAFVGGDGAVYLGLFDGLIKGSPDGCGFAPVPELDKKYIADLAADPIDPKRTYAITTNPQVENSVWMNDGNGTFVPFGTGVTKFLDTIDVVKNGDGRRFYVTGVLTDAMTNKVVYSVRVSDDDAATWTEDAFDMALFPPMDMYAEFAIVAINPTNPDHIVGRLWRKQIADTLLYSTEKGKAGSWKVLAEASEIDSVAYSTDGALFFGDSDQNSKGIWVVEMPGDAPKLLTASWKPTCLGYDQANKRLLGCGNYYLFGEVDVKSGELKPTLDLRCTEHIAECSGQESMVKVCEPQALQDFCHLTHWVLAPVCDVYDRGPELASFQMAQTFACSGGFAVPKPEGMPTAGAAVSGVAGTGATTPDASAGTVARSTGNAGSSAPAAGVTGSRTATNADAPAATSQKSSGGGCSTVANASSDASGALLLSIGGLALFALRRPRRARTQRPCEADAS